MYSSSNTEVRYFFKDFFQVRGVTISLHFYLVKSFQKKKKSKSTLCAVFSQNQKGLLFFKTYLNQSDSSSLEIKFWFVGVIVETEQAAPLPVAECSVCTLTRMLIAPN